MTESRAPYADSPFTDDDPLQKAEARIDFLEGELQKIVNWANAYPLDIFPEPDFKKVRAALEAAGISLDQVSASNMRHVVTGVGNIARNALSTSPQNET